MNKGLVPRPRPAEVVAIGIMWVAPCRPTAMVAAMAIGMGLRMVMGRTTDMAAGMDIGTAPLVMVMVMVPTMVMGMDTATGTALTTVTAEVMATTATGQATGVSQSRNILETPLLMGAAIMDEVAAIMVAVKGEALGTATAMGTDVVMVTMVTAAMTFRKGQRTAASTLGNSIRVLMAKILKMVLIADTAKMGSTLTKMDRNLRN